jgi:serine/threonine-protein kinase
MAVVSVALLDLHDQAPIKWWNFDHPASISIGRAVNNDVVVPDPLVSRHHVELRKVLHAWASENWQLTNQGKNGTFLNSNLVFEAIVTHGDVIQLAPKGPKLKVFLNLTDSPPKLKQTPQSKIPPNITRQQSDAVCPMCGQFGHNRQDLFCFSCGNPLQVWETIRHYHIFKLLSRGGMGTTFLASRSPDAAFPQFTHSDRLVVLKQMNPEVCHLPKARELFAREAATLRQLHHPGIPKFLDFFTEADQLYLVMELIHGKSLDALLRQKGVAPIPQVMDWGIQICQVLEDLHQQEPCILHRDIKPANILLRHQDDRIIVVDFGAVKFLSTTAGTRITAGGYTAPEQEQGLPCIQSDLYSLGATLVFLLTGKNPVGIHRYQDQTPEHYLAAIPGISLGLAQILSGLLQPEAIDRFQSAARVKEALLAEKEKGKRKESLEPERSTEASPAVG